VTKYLFRNKQIVFLKVISKQFYEVANEFPGTLLSTGQVQELKAH
jgi:hypothetical protein